jgi:hypothetical protein
MDVVCCCIRVVSSRKGRRERVGVGSRGTYPGAPPHHRKNEKNKPTVKVPDRPSGERGKAKKKKKVISVVPELARQL